MVQKFDHLENFLVQDENSSSWSEKIIFNLSRGCNNQYRTGPSTPQYGPQEGLQLIVNDVWGIIINDSVFKRPEGVLDDFYTNTCGYTLTSTYYKFGLPTALIGFGSCCKYFRRLVPAMLNGPRCFPFERIEGEYYPRRFIESFKIPAILSLRPLHRPLSSGSSTTIHATLSSTFQASMISAVRELRMFSNCCIETPPVDGSSSDDLFDDDGTDLVFKPREKQINGLRIKPPSTLKCFAGRYFPQNLFGDLISPVTAPLFSNLVKLVLSGDVQHVVVQSLPQFPNLRDLVLAGNIIGNFECDELVGDTDDHYSGLDSREDSWEGKENFHDLGGLREVQSAIASLSKLSSLFVRSDVLVYCSQEGCSFCTTCITPNVIGKLTNLTSLSAKNLKLRSVHTLSSLTNLTKLALVDADTLMDHNISNLTNLTELEVRRCPSFFGDACGNFRKLQKLTLDIPECDFSSHYEKFIFPMLTELKELKVARAPYWVEHDSYYREGSLFLNLLKMPTLERLQIWNPTESDLEDIRIAKETRPSPIFPLPDRKSFPDITLLEMDTKDGWPWLEFATLIDIPSPKTDFPCSVIEIQ